MNEPKHTQGPWSVDGLTIADKNGNTICWMGEPAQYPGDLPVVCDNDTENARLIAAAPEMFEVLSLVLDFDNGNISTARGNYENIIECVRAALAKVAIETSNQ